MSEEFYSELLTAKTQCLLEDQIVRSGNYCFDFLHAGIIERMRHEPSDSTKQTNNHRSAEVNTHWLKETMFLSDVGIPNSTLLAQVFREQHLCPCSRIVTKDSKLDTILQSLRTFEAFVKAWIYCLNAMRDSWRERNTRRPELSKYLRIWIFTFRIVFDRLLLATPRLSWRYNTRKVSIEADVVKSGYLTRGSRHDHLSVCVSEDGCSQSLEIDTDESKRCSHHRSMPLPAFGFRTNT